ncbi:DUF4405 domain-containing protein [Chloroflexota bacterium]
MTRKIIHWSLFAVMIIYMISGFGISYFRVVETVTFGLLTKPIAFKMHDYTLIPFIILLILHVFMNQITRLLSHIKKRDK